MHEQGMFRAITEISVVHAAIFYQFISTYQFSQKKKLNSFSFNFPPSKTPVPKHFPPEWGVLREVLLCMFWYIHNLESTYQRRGKAVRWLFYCKQTCEDVGRWVCWDIMLPCVFLSMNAVLVRCFVIYMTFFYESCSNYIENLWNERGLSSIVTPFSPTSSTVCTLNRKIHSQAQGPWTGPRLLPMGIAECAVIMDFQSPSFHKLSI